MPTLPFQRVSTRLVQALQDYDDQKTALEVLGTEGTADKLESFEQAVITQLMRVIDGIDWKNQPVKNLKQLSALTDPTKVYDRVPLSGPYDGVARVYSLPVPAIHTLTAFGPKVKIYHGGRSLAHATVFGTDIPEYRVYESIPSMGYDTVEFTFGPTQLLLADFIAV